MSAEEEHQERDKPVPRSNNDSERPLSASVSDIQSEKPLLKDEESEINRIEELKNELESERKKTADVSKRILYLQSDYINLQRQYERRIAETRDETKLHYLQELISVKEDLERALSIGKTTNSSALMDGLRLLLSRIEGTLRMDEIELINVSPGSLFDIRLHEAVAYSEGNHEKEGTVLSVVSNGYTMRGKVIKPALVEVARQNRDIEASREDEDRKRPVEESERKGSKNQNENELQSVTNSRDSNKN